MKPVEREELKKLAEAEHELWVEEMFENGWTYGPNTDYKRNILNSLVSFNDLEKKDQDLKVRRMERILISGGFIVASEWTKYPHGFLNKSDTEESAKDTQKISQYWSDYLLSWLRNKRVYIRLACRKVFVRGSWILPHTIQWWLRLSKARRRTVAVIAFLGSVASIIGLYMTFFPPRIGESGKQIQRSWRTKPELSRQLIEASINGDVETAYGLLRAGAPVNGLNRNEKEIEITPLIAASEKGYEQLVRLLCDYGADVNQRNKHFRTPLIAAAEASQGNIAGILLLNSCTIVCRAPGA